MPAPEEVPEELRQRVLRMVSEGMSDRARFGRASICTLADGRGRAGRYRDDADLAVEQNHTH